ncbi:hypothetical protein I4U23_013218 [Adineta vaga]|nr:hypothetical protein I4U23_013218 [Adineta vaga]
MTCLVHNPRYRSLFHSVINDLRNEDYVSTSTLRTMPRKCCTCHDADNLTLKSLLINDRDKLINLKKLADQIDHDKQDNPVLVLALNRLENIIKENRIQSSPTLNRRYSSSSSNSDDRDHMDTNKRLAKKKKNQPKPLKNGIFLFLPYNFEVNGNSDTSLQKRKEQQRGRLISRTGYIAALEKQNNVCINMITSSTTKQVTKTLENAKEGIGNVKIHDAKNLPDTNDGEWLLIRPKKSAKKEETIDYESVLNDLQDRWETFLTIKKRKNEDNHEHRRKNCKF